MVYRVERHMDKVHKAKHIDGPIPDIEIRSGSYRLVIPDEKILEQLADLVRNGVHPEEFMPFSVPWTDTDPDTAADGYVKWVKRSKMQSTPRSWRLCFALLDGDHVVGAKSLQAENFGEKNVVSTGSWIGLSYQGRGLGTLMRIAVLALAFDHLGAKLAISEAFEDNLASCRVNEKLGYSLVRQQELVRRSAIAIQNVYELDASHWRNSHTPEVSVLAPDEWRTWFRGNYS